MSLSAELQERYTTEVDVDWRHAFVLSHPTAETKYICSHSAEMLAEFNGLIRTFQPVPTEIVPAGMDDSGKSDMQISWCGVCAPALDFLFQALEDATKPIVCHYTVLIIGDPTPQIDPYMEFQLSAVSVTDMAVSATASRSNILNLPFPTELYRVSKYPGLRRR